MGRNIDSVLVFWGDRLFYPGNRIVRSDPQPHLKAQANAIRGRIAGLVGRSPQVIVKVSGGGRGMAAITAHLSYIAHEGRLEFEDDRGTVRDGKEALRDLADQWRYSGTHIANVASRREALNVMLAMPAGTDAEQVKNAAREFARTELAGHRYVMVLHKHQSSPHVHLCVKHESRTGERLSIGTSDLMRWRETFAEMLRSQGVKAEATCQVARGATRNFDPLWRMKVKEKGELRMTFQPTKGGPAFEKRCAEAMDAWRGIVTALNQSERADDRKLALQFADFLCHTPYIREVLRRDPAALPGARRYLEAQQERIVTLERSGPEMVR